MIVMEKVSDFPQRIFGNSVSVIHMCTFHAYLHAAVCSCMQVL